MTHNEINKIQVRTYLESPEAVIRYKSLVELGKKIFDSSSVKERGKITKENILLARDCVAKGITATNPEVWADYFNHIIISPELGRKTALALQKSGFFIDPNLIEFLLWQHELARLVIPAEYFRNDLINDRLMQEIGISKPIINELPPLTRLMEVADEMNLTQDQLTNSPQLTDKQETLANAYFQSLTPTQRIINLADNLGKRGENGIFDIPAFLQYLRTQEERYREKSPWPSINWAIERRQQGAILQAYTIENTIEWLKKEGVDFPSILASLIDYGPKFVIVVRHGELDNHGMLYNRDEVMKQEDIVHLSQIGKKQMEAVGALVKRRRFPVSFIAVSPETRARESAEEVNRSLKLPQDKVMRTENLDDLYAPGPYLERITIREWAKVKGDCYDQKQWGKYHHEKIGSIIQRMEAEFRLAASKLAAGKSSILISHGDPIAWLLNKVIHDEVPAPKDLRDKIYPNKGQAVVVIIGPDEKIFSYYTLTDKSLIKGTSY